MDDRRLKLGRCSSPLVGNSTKHVGVLSERGGNLGTQRLDGPNVLHWVRREGKKGDDRSQRDSSDKIFRPKEIGRSRSPIGGADEAKWTAGHAEVRTDPDDSYGRATASQIEPRRKDRN